MLNETFYLDGIDARSSGIQLQAPIEFSEAVPVVEAQTIPGRNGDLIWETGSYENRSGSASCFCLQKDVEKAISSAGRFLMGKKGYRRLETSDDPDHYWMARVENSPQIAMRLRTLAPFAIGFDCKPQRFLKSGEIPIPLDISVFGTETEVYNQYGFASKPLFILEADPNEEQRLARITINGKICTIGNISGTVYIDSDLQNVYNEEGNQNMNAVCPDFPVLEAGKNVVSVYGTGYMNVRMIPRWWEL